MKVLVTGGAGFIGGHVVRRLGQEGHEAVVLDDLSRGRRQRLPAGAELQLGDVADAEAVARAVRGVEAVVHLAARTSVPESLEDPAGYARTNVVGTWNVLRAAADAGVVRVVLASSAAVYGVPQEDVQRETQVPRPEDPYALSKLANEQQASCASASGGPATTCLRFFNVYGPDQDPTGPYASVVPRFLDHALAGRPLPVHGTGAQERDFVHVADVVESIMLALERRSGHLVCNIGSGRGTSVLHVAGLVRRLCPGTGQVHTPPRPGDVPCSVADTGRARKEMGYRPTVGLEEGLRGTYEELRSER